MISDEKLRDLATDSFGWHAEQATEGYRRFADAILAAELGGGRRVEGCVQRNPRPTESEFRFDETGKCRACQSRQGAHTPATLILHDLPQPKEHDCPVCHGRCRGGMATVSSEVPQPKSAEERVKEALKVYESVCHSHGNEKCVLCEVGAILRGERP